MFAYNPMRLNIGSIGLCKYSYVRGLVSPDYVVFGCDTENLLPEFLNYAIQGLEWRQWTSSAGVGSVRQRIYYKELARLSLTIPPISAQKDIVKILSTLDDKIELNRQINQTLEQIAQTIFKSWFVDFEPVKSKIEAKAAGRDPERAAMCAISGTLDSELDQLPPEQRQQLAATVALFPDELVESELAVIPQGWDVDSLSKIMDIKGGTQPPASQFIEEPREGYVRLVQIRDYETDAHLTFIPDSKSLRKTTPMEIMIGRYGASVGRILWGLAGAYNVALVQVEIKGKYLREYLRTFLLSNAFQGPMAMMSGRSAQSGFNKVDIASFRITIPSEKTLEKYEEVCQPMREQGLKLKEQIADLQNVRDTMLPKLLTGELTIGECECQA